ncbi:Guanylate cyclase soluble subunit beta-1 (GCS-beta-1) (Guanylate cyclase soluble subunit beta-3) (GCS-beta-3) (Soluble guanylate cyclase small subunit) [Durusdinium trenchii]|uniref:Guanylate cyclase soluble subunit beta-1 (GCS-beta-1) (Guanylate cyclase soluble subunit beta-3) (GCS-beta-3) (Soluble guanylate cyclase small subunit) n=2 Tax=Durusdinium trenchii TaxID=1381693 RepID=A0ABP0I021_9DINO
MYGHIHIILKDLVLSMYGKEKWASILKRVRLTEEEILEPVQQPDEVSFSLLGATCQETNLNLEDALEAFGRHFVGYMLQSGYARLIKAVGKTFPAFLANVNYLHNHLERQHPHALFPYIEVNYQDGADSLQLHYLSTRSNMSKVLVGILNELGREVFDLEVSIAAMACPPRYARKADSSKCAASFQISWKPAGRKGSKCSSTTASETSRHTEAKHMSFASLHLVMMDFGQLFSRSFDVSSCCTQQAQQTPCIECVDLIPSEADRKFDEVKSHSSPRPEEVLLRATPSCCVAAGWCDDHMETCTEFWSSSDGTSSHYELSQDAATVDVFVSHSWSPPADWAKMMGDEVIYGEVKAAMLAVMAKDYAMQTEQRCLKDWGQTTFWVDKACIAQDHPELKAMSIALLERFIQMCDSMCVLFTWTYLERLWCVYEWACVLIHKPTEKVYLQTELFVKEQTLPLYIEAVRNFSLKQTKCHVEEDRRILEMKIEESYVSKEHFEVLVQATVIALMARSMAFRAGRSPILYATYFQPWVLLARDLGMDELAKALESCNCLTWRRVSTISSEGNAVRPLKSGGSVSSANWSTSLDRSPISEKSHPLSPESQDELMQMSIGVNSLLFHQVISDWFEIDVVPILSKFQVASTK